MRNLPACTGLETAQKAIRQEPQYGFIPQKKTFRHLAFRSIFAFLNWKRGDKH